MPHLLELFSGTGSIGRVFRDAGWTVTSVDISPHFRPDICCDVLDLTPEMVGAEPDVIWASPPCTHYSRARTTAKTPRDLEGSDRIVNKVLEIISWYPGVFYFIENPMGMMRNRPMMIDIPRRTVDYCMYADHRFPRYYRKRTDIWTNTDWYPWRPLCNRRCQGCDGSGRHVYYAQRIPKNGAGGNTLHDLYAIPPALPEEFVEHLMFDKYWG